jgi:hypothetical protein
MPIAENLVQATREKVRGFAGRTTAEWCKKPGRGMLVADQCQNLHSECGWNIESLTAEPEDTLEDCSRSICKILSISQTVNPGAGSPLIHKARHPARETIGRATPAPDHRLDFACSIMLRSR